MPSFIRGERLVDHSTGAVDRAGALKAVFEDLGGKGLRLPETRIGIRCGIPDRVESADRIGKGIPGAEVVVLVQRLDKMLIDPFCPVRRRPVLPQTPARAARMRHRGARFPGTAGRGHGDRKGHRRCRRPARQSHPVLQKPRRISRSGQISRSNAALKTIIGVKMPCVGQGKTRFFHLWFLHPTGVSGVVVSLYTIRRENGRL